MASLTLTDSDAVEEGVNHYKVFVRKGTLPGTNIALDKYQIVTATGVQDIDLENVMNGPIIPADGESVYFTVVAYDAAQNASTPSANDSTMITWDKAAPGQPTGLTLVDNLGDGTMTYSWSDQSTDDDLDHFVVYFNKGAEATPTSYAVKSGPYTKSYTGNNLITGAGKILDRLGAQEGDVIHITVYAVDHFGNESEPAKTSSTYSLSN